MAEEQTKTEAKSPGVTPSKIAVYQKVAIHTDKIIKTLIDKLDSGTESIALGAANKLIDKILPDLKATELTGEGNAPVVIKVITDNGNRPSNQELPQTASDI